MIAILELRGGQSVEPGGVLIQKLAILEMQLAAEQFAYRAFHARETAIIGLQLASPTGAFFRPRSVSFCATR